MVALLEQALSRKATQGVILLLKSAAAVAAAPALRAVTGLHNLAALVSPLLCQERACGAAAGAGAEAALMDTTASASWLEALAVAAAAARYRSAQMER